MPYTLVRKRAYGALSRGMSSHPYAKRAKMAYGAAKFVYNNRSKFKRAARTIGRAYRQAKRRRIQNAPVSKGGQFKDYFAGSFSTADSVITRKTLLADTIKFALPPDTNETLHAAPAMSFRVKGFKICYHLYNTAAVPVHLHMAIVQPKQPKITGSDIPKDMFVNPTSPLDKYTDFVNATTDPNWDNEQDCSNLNRTKFNILTHKRILLNGVGGGTVPMQSEKGSTWVRREQYFKLGKRFQFETPAATEVMNPLWILMWFETVKPTNALSTSVGYHLSTMSYFGK